MPSTPPKIMLNGVEVAPINKRKLPLEVDWQAVVREKQKEEALAKKDEQVP